MVSLDRSRSHLFAPNDLFLSANSLFQPRQTLHQSTRRFLVASFLYNHCMIFILMHCLCIKKRNIVRLSQTFHHCASVFPIVIVHSASLNLVRDDVSRSRDYHSQRNPKLCTDVTASPLSSKVKRKLWFFRIFRPRDKQSSCDGCEVWRIVRLPLTLSFGNTDREILCHSNLKQYLLIIFRRRDLDVM